jgi:hypothetical protein
MRILFSECCNEILGKTISNLPRFPIEMLLLIEWHVMYGLASILFNVGTAHTMPPSAIDFSLSPYNYIQIGSGARWNEELHGTNALDIMSGCVRARIEECARESRFLANPKSAASAEKWSRASLAFSFFT